MGGMGDEEGKNSFYYRRKFRWFITYTKKIKNISHIKD